MKSKERRLTVANASKHIRTVIIHKWFVLKYCIRFGIPFRGIVHDMSKFSPTELIESIRYYDGKVSPIVRAKEDKGFSDAWFHHKGRNKHHYEYWMDNFDDGGENIPMPYKYAVEMIADYLAAGRAYVGKGFTYEDEWNWWIDRCKKNLAMHPSMRRFVTLCLHEMCVTDDVISRDRLKHNYDNAIIGTIGM